MAARPFALGTVAPRYADATGIAYSAELDRHLLLEKTKAAAPAPRMQFVVPSVACGSTSTATASSPAVYYLPATRGGGAASAPSLDPAQEQVPQLRRVRDVFLAFCTATESRQGGMHRFVKNMTLRFSGRIGHVEPVFAFDDGSLLACAIGYDKPVHFQMRDPIEAYVRERWETYKIELTPLERERLWQFCVAQNGKPYNKRAFWCNFVPFLRACCGTQNVEGVESPAWLCTEMIMAGLQYARPRAFPPDQFDPSTITPDKLYEIVQTKKLFSRVVSAMSDKQLQALQL